MEVSGDVARCGPDPGPEARSAGGDSESGPWTSTAQVKLGDRPALPRGPVTAHGPSPKNNFFATVRARPVRPQGSRFDFKFDALVPLKALGLALPDRILNGPVWFLFWFLSCVVEFRKHFHPSETGPIWVGQRMALALDAWVASVDSFAQYRKELKPTKTICCQLV